MKKILILSIWILASATQLFAISQGDTNHNEFYRKEYDKLYNKYKDNPQSIVNIVGMAEFYSSPNNPMKNYNMAITFITDAEKRYLALVNNNSEYKEVNKLIKKKITISSIRKQKQFIIDEVLKYAQGGNVSLPECKEYMNAFASFPAVVEEIKKVESSLAYKECKQINTIKSYASFINEHPNSAEKALAVDIVVKMVLAEIENAETEEKVNLASIDYTNDVIKKHSEKKKSKIAYSKALKTNTLEGYRSFLSQYPSCDEYMVALDRIEKIEESSVKYQETTIDFSTYFDDIIGVTNYANEPVEHILFWVSDNSKDYVKTKPIHGSQRCYTGDRELALRQQYLTLQGGAFFSIDCKYNYELIRELCSFGSDLLVLSPVGIQDKVYERIDRTMSEYSKMR